MRTMLSPLVGILLIFATVAGVPAIAQDGQPGPPQDEESSGPGNGNAGSSGKGNSETARANWPECREAFESDENVSEPEHECHQYYRESGQGSSDRARHVREYQEEYEEQHADERARAEAKHDRVGLVVPPSIGVPGFRVNESGYYGDQVSFVPSVHNSSVYDLYVGGALLIKEIKAPGPVDPHPRLLEGNRFMMHGLDGWTLRMLETKEGALVSFDAEQDAPFLVTFPTDVEVVWLTQTPHALIQYPGVGLTAKVNHSNGGIEAAPENPGNNSTAANTYMVWGNARFMAGVEQGATAHSRVLRDAQLDGKLGAELDVYRGRGDGKVAALTTVYEDMELEFESADLGPVTGAPGSIYTITVDSPVHEGKTIALNMESGLVTAESLVFRYYNVHPNATIPATIVQADDVHDVLDPLDDGVVAEWWVIEDINGVQVLISIPHFSIHKIEMQNLGEIIIEQPSLVLGVIGAILVVGAATRAMFRSPRE